MAQPVRKIVGPEPPFDRELAEVVEIQDAEIVGEIDEDAIGSVVGRFVGFLFACGFAGLTVWFATTLPPGEAFVSWLFLTALFTVAGGAVDLLGKTALQALLKLPVLVGQMALTVWVFRHVAEAWLPWWRDGYLPLRLANVPLGDIDPLLAGRWILGVSLFAIALGIVGTIAQLGRRLAGRTDA